MDMKYIVSASQVSVRVEPGSLHPLAAFCRAAVELRRKTKIQPAWFNFIGHKRDVVRVERYMKHMFPGVATRCIYTIVRKHIRLYDWLCIKGIVKRRPYMSLKEFNNGSY